MLKIVLHYYYVRLSVFSLQSSVCLTSVLNNIYIVGMSSVAPGQKATATHLRVYCSADKCDINTSLPGPCFCHGLYTHTSHV